MFGVIGFLEGRAEIFADSENRERFISFLIENDIGAKVRYCGENGGVYTEISPLLLKKIAPALDKSGIIVYIINIYGLKHILNNIIRRPGIVLASVLFAAILWVSTLFDWRVEISGNEQLTKGYLKETLLTYGVGEGVKLSDIDEREISAQIVSLCPEIAWAALNLRGTTVTLEIRETNFADEDEELTSDILVAEKSGIIREIEVYSGKAAVEVGTVVKAGDLLISGFISGNGLQYSETPGIRYEGASGRVRAEISETAEVFVPFESESVTELRGKASGISISVFGSNISIGKTQDGSEEGRRLSFFGEIELPVTYRVSYDAETVTETRTVSEDEASLEAERLIYGKIIETCGDGELTSVSVRYETTEEGIGAAAEITYITEIALGKNIK